MLVIATGCGGGSSPRPPSTDAAAACAAATVRPLAEQLIADVAKWDDEIVIARSVPRLSLAPEIAKLQEIRRHAQGLSGPPCLTEPRDLAVDFMNASIALHTAFLGQESTVGLEDRALVARRSFDSRLASLASTIEMTVRPNPTPTPFRIAKRAVALALTASDVGAGYQTTSPGSGCNQTTTDCAIAAFVATSILTGDPSAILNIVAVFSTDADASDFLIRSARRPDGEQVMQLTVGLGDESAGWFYVAETPSIALYVRRANAVSQINLVGVSGPTRAAFGIGLASKQLDRMR